MHLVSPRPSPGKMYEVKRKGETGTGFSEISPDLILGAIHVMPTILVILLIKVYMSTSNVSYVSTTLIFARFFKIQIKNHLTEKRVWYTFLLVFNRSAKEHVTGHIQSDWPHDLIYTLESVPLFSRLPFSQTFRQSSLLFAVILSDRHPGCDYSEDLFCKDDFFALLFVLY